MVCCPSCGGVIGRDCWNPQECAWITQQMIADDAVRRALHEIEANEYAKQMQQEYGEHLQREWYEHIGFDPVAMGM